MRRGYYTGSRGDGDGGGVESWVWETREQKRVVGRSDEGSVGEQ